MRSAWRTVEKRWEMMMVVHCRVAASRRSKISASPRTSSCAVGSSSSTTPAPSSTAHSARASAIALPLTAGQIGAALVSAREHRVERARDPTRPPTRAPREISSGDAPVGATLSRSGSSRRMKSWNTAAIRVRHDAKIELAEIDAVDFDRAGLRVVQPAQQLRQRRFSGAVLSDDGERRPGGNREIEMLEDRARRRDTRTSRRESGSPGPASSPRCACQTRGRPPSPSKARDEERRRLARRCRRSAQLSPPNAIIDVATALCAKMTTRPSVKSPCASGARERPEHDDVRDRHEQHAPDHRPFAQPRRGVLELVQPRPPRDEAVDRPASQAEEAQFFARGRVDGKPIRVVGVALCGAHFIRVAIEPDRALAQEPVRRQPRAGQQQSAPTTHTRRERPPMPGRQSARRVRQR